jgi:hypothetical protein
MNIPDRTILVNTEPAENIAQASNPLLAYFPRVQSSMLDKEYFRPRLPEEDGYEEWLNSVNWCYQGKTPTPHELLEFHNKVFENDIGDILWAKKDDITQGIEKLKMPLTEFIHLSRISSKWKLIVQFRAKLELTAAFYSETHDIFDLLFEFDDLVKHEKVSVRDKMIADYFGVRAATMNDFRITATPTAKIMAAAKMEAENKLKIVSDTFHDLADTDVNEDNKDIVNAKSKKLSAIDNHVMKIAAPIIERLAPPKQKVEIGQAGDIYVSFKIQDGK